MERNNNRTLFFTFILYHLTPPISFYYTFSHWHPHIPPSCSYLIALNIIISEVYVEVIPDSGWGMRDWLPDPHRSFGRHSSVPCFHCSFIIFRMDRHQVPLGRESAHLVGIDWSGGGERVDNTNTIGFFLIQEYKSFIQAIFKYLTDMIQVHFKISYVVNPAARYWGGCGGRSKYSSWHSFSTLEIASRTLLLLLFQTPYYGY